MDRLLPHCGDQPVIDLALLKRLRFVADKCPCGLYRDKGWHISS